MRAISKRQLKVAKLVNAYTTFESPEQAKAIASQNKLDDPDWYYDLRQLGPNKFVIEVKDEYGEILGNL